MSAPIPPRSPFRSAALLASGYLIVSLVYIAVSSRLAAQLASGTQELEAIERYKGFGFVVVTGLLLFVFAYALLLRWKRLEELRAEESRALVVAQHKSLAAEMAASVAHDFRNLLGIIQGSAELMEATPSPQELEAFKADIVAATVRGEQLADKMIAAARGDVSAKKRPIGVRDTVLNCLQFVRRSKRIRDCQLDARFTFDGTAELDELLVCQVLSNLIMNAADATGNHGRVLVTVERVREAVIIEVHDDGPGLLPSTWQELVVPYRTTKRGGTGLGLVSVRDSVASHGGTVELVKSQLGGAAFRIWLPVGSDKPS